MGSLLGGLIPFALGIAISPVPIIAVIMMLSSKKALANAMLFVAGWVVALVVGSTVAALLFSHSGASAGPQGSASTQAIVHLVLGVLLLALGAHKWWQRRQGVPEKQPRLLKSIEGIKPAQALVFGFAMIVVNPKNLLLLVSAVDQVAQVKPGVTTGIIALLVFVCLASVSVLLPLFVYAFFRQRAAAILAGWNGWLSAHNAVVMMYLLTVLGVFLLAKGIVGLVG